MSDSDHSFDPRSFVLLTGAASVACTAGLAGCLGDGDVAGGRGAAATHRTRHEGIG